jgi:hypothetical protein
MNTKLLLAILALLCLVFKLEAQCDPSQSTTASTLTNDFRVLNTSPFGNRIFHFVPDLYYSPPVIPITTTYTLRRLWMGGYDPQGNLSLAASRYGDNGITDYKSGPILINGDLNEDELCSYYSRVWSIYDEDIIALKEDFRSGQLNIEDIPVDILEWPAKNNPHNGQFAVDYDMAPYVDINSDGIYDPLDGDYPIALEENPDFSAYAFNFYVYNDNVTHVLSRGNIINMEIHQIRYLTQCPSTDELDRSIFNRIKYIYKGTVPLTQFKIGLWEDSDLGCYFNSYNGCSAELNSTYVYSRKQTSQYCGGNQGLPSSSYAIRSTVFLNEDIVSFMPTINPNFPSQSLSSFKTLNYYKSLCGLWVDGTPLTSGGTGYDSLNNGLITNLAYPDFPNNPGGWSMLVDSVPYPDIKPVTTVYNDDLMPGQQGVIDFADHVKFSDQYDDENMFEIFPDVINKLREEYNMALNNNLECNIPPCIVDCVWPGDINCDYVVDGHDVILSGVYSGRGITQGPSRMYESIRWAGFDSEYWDTSHNLGNINARFGDVNGEGIIDTADFYYTTFNIGKSHPNYVKEQEELTTEGDVILKATFEIDSIDLDTANLFDRLIIMELFLGEVGQALSEPIHGLTFNMQLDTQVIEILESSLDINKDSLFQYNSTIEYETSGELGRVIDNSGPVILSNYNGVNQSQGFRIFSETLHIKRGSVTGNPDGRDTLQVCLYNVKAINAEGEKIDIGGISDEIIISNMLYDPNLVSDKEIHDTGNAMLIYPNPVNKILNLRTDYQESSAISIFDLQGCLIITQKLEDSKTKVDVGDLSPGLYLIQYHDEDTQRTMKFTKM